MEPASILDMDRATKPDLLLQNSGIGEATVWFRVSVFAVAMMGLSACAYHASDNTSFSVRGDDSFTFQATADAINKLDSQEGESVRIRALEEWLRMNSKCPSGYEITSRTPVVRREGLLSKIYDVHYEGSCRA